VDRVPRILEDRQDVPADRHPGDRGRAPRGCSFPATGPRGVAWTPDGRQLIVGNLRDRKAELWRVPAAGGEPVRLDVAVNGMWQFRLHPDGRRLAMEVWENNEEVWPSRTCCRARSRSHREWPPGASSAWTRMWPRVDRPGSDLLLVHGLGDRGSRHP